MYASHWLMLAVVCGLISAGDSQANAQTDSTHDASDIRCSGVVVDEGGAPVSGADVFFCSTPATWIGVCANPWPVASMASPTNAEGQFEFSFRRDDRRFLFGHYATLVVQKQGFAQVTQRVHYFRLMVDLPLQISLPSSAGRPVKVVDYRGEPVVGAKVCVCSSGSAATPLEIATRFESVTSDEGLVVVEGLTSQSVPLLYVRSNVCGNQCVRCQFDGGQWIARLQESFDRDLQIELPSDATSDRLGEIEVRTIIPISNFTPSTQVPIEFAWSSARADSTGRIRLPKIVGATTALLDTKVPDELGFQPNMRMVAPGWAEKSTEPLRIPFRRAIPIHGQVVSSVDGRPLTNLVVGTFSTNVVTATDQEGRYELSIAEGNVFDYTVRDPFGDYQIPSTVYMRVSGLVGVESIEEKPVAMLPCPLLRGTVRDREGNAIAGATIKCQKKKDFYVYDTVSFTSDANGEYTLRGLASGDVIELTAIVNPLATDETKTVSVGGDANLDLVIEPAEFLRFHGTVTDSNGSPIANAEVALSRANVFQAEGQDMEQMSPAPLIDGAPSILTNTSGEFLSSETVEWRRKVQVKVQAAGFLEYCSPWLDVDDLPRSGDRLTAARLVLTREPDARSTLVSVVDAEGNPLPSAKVVFVGALTGAVRGTTDENGRTSMQVKRGLQVFAVESADLRHHFQTIDAIDDTLVVRINSSESQADARIPASLNTAQRCRDVAARWLQEFADLSLKESSLFRIRNLLGLQAVADPEGFRNWMRPDSGLQDAIQNGELAISLLSDVSSRDTSGFLRLHDLLIPAQPAKEPDPRTRLFIEIEQAGKLHDADERLEHLSELVIRCRQLSGSDQTIVFGQLAGVLWRNGHREEARSVLREARELNPALDATERGTENLAGIGRRFASIYAIVDPQEAFRLIELTCYKEEIDTYKMAALAFVSESDPEQFVELTKDLKKEAVTGYFDSILNSLALDELSAVERIADLLPEGDVRWKFMASVAERFASNPKMRGELPSWFRRIFETLDRSSYQSYYESPAVVAAGLTHTAQSVSPATADRAIFSALWCYEPNDFDQPKIVLSSMAQSISVARPTLARALIAPLFEETSWLHASSSPLVFYRCPPLRAACRVNLDWGIELLERLWATRLRGSVSQRLAIAVVAASELQRRIFEIEDLEQSGRD